MTALGTVRAEAKACRAAFADSKVGDAVWCLHHQRLIETLIETPIEPAEDRIAYILSKKPKAERARRLREFRPVLGPLPEPFDRARTEYEEAWAEYDRACARSSAEYVRAVAEYDRAKAEYVRARAEAMPALEAQHRAEYPGSTWNGQSIFGEAV